MSVTITRALADAYFAPDIHINGSAWGRFGESTRDAAIAHAQRIISRTIESEITDETIDESDGYRPDYAVYEQALYMAVNSAAIARGDMVGPMTMSIDLSEGDKTRKKDKSIISPEALRWLRKYARQIEVWRG